MICLSLFMTVQTFSKTGSHEVHRTGFVISSSSDFYGVIDRLEPDLQQQQLLMIRRVMFIYDHLEQIVNPCSKTLQHCDSVKPTGCFTSWWKHQISFTLLSKWHHQTSKYRFKHLKLQKYIFNKHGFDITECRRFLFSGFLRLVLISVNQLLFH